MGDCANSTGAGEKEIRLFYLGKKEECCWWEWLKSYDHWNQFLYKFEKKKNHFIFLLRKLANDPLPFELLIGNNGLHI